MRRKQCTLKQLIFPLTIFHFWFQLPCGLNIMRWEPKKSDVSWWDSVPIIINYIPRPPPPQISNASFLSNVLISPLEWNIFMLSKRKQVILMTVSWSTRYKYCGFYISILNNMHVIWPSCHREHIFMFHIANYHFIKSIKSKARWS